MADDIDLRTRTGGRGPIATLEARRRVCLINLLDVRPVDALSGRIELVSSQQTTGPSWSGRDSDFARVRDPTTLVDSGGGDCSGPVMIEPCSVAPIPGAR
jgi:hypothetical protein